MDVFQRKGTVSRPSGPSECLYPKSIVKLVCCCHHRSGVCSPTSLCESGTNQGCHVQGVVTCVSPVGDGINTQRINFAATCMYSTFSCDVTVMWKPYRRPFWCTVEWRLSMLHDAHATCSPDLTANGLTSQVCLISLPGTRYLGDVSALAA